MNSSTHSSRVPDPSGPTHWGTKYKPCEAGSHPSPINMDGNSLDTFMNCNKVPAPVRLQANSTGRRPTGTGIWSRWIENGTKTHPITTRSCSRPRALISCSFISMHRQNTASINRHADAEMHLVHQSADGQVAMAVVLLHALYNKMPRFEQAFDPRGEVNHSEGVEEKKDPEAKEEEDDEGEEMGMMKKRTRTRKWWRLSKESEKKLEARAAPHEDEVCSGKETTRDDAKTIEVKVSSPDLSPLFRVIGRFSPRWEYQGSLTTPPCSEHVYWNRDAQFLPDRPRTTSCLD